MLFYHIHNKVHFCTSICFAHEFCLFNWSYMCKKSPYQHWFDFKNTLVRHSWINKQKKIKIKLRNFSVPAYFQQIIIIEHHTLNNSRQTICVHLFIRERKNRVTSALSDSYIWRFYWLRMQFHDNNKFEQIFCDYKGRIEIKIEFG